GGDEEHDQSGRCTQPLSTQTAPPAAQAARRGSDTMSSTLTGRVALVTGGTGALGQAVTRRLLADGATVAAPFIVDDERDRLQAGVDAAAKDRLLLVRADVTDERAVGDLVNPLQARPRPR